MSQTYEVFKGDPETLVSRLNQLKGDGATQIEVSTSFSRAYVIVYQAAPVQLFNLLQQNNDLLLQQDGDDLLIRS
jgi:hypothetical protein